jgi:hypothetical protein
MTIDGRIRVSELADWPASGPVRGRVLVEFDLPLSPAFAALLAEPDIALAVLAQLAGADLPKEEGHDG